MVSSPGLGPIKSQLWAALWTLWLIRFLSVSYMSASPMQNLYQVLLSTYMNCCIFLCLFWCRNSLLLTLAPLTALVICRDIGLIAAVFWVRYKTVPPPVRHTPVNFEFSLLGVAWECLSGGFTGNVHLTVGPLLCHLQVTLSKFFNPCYTTAQLKPTLFSKVTNTHPDSNHAPAFDSDWFVWLTRQVNTAVQLLLVAASLAGPVFQYTDSVPLQCLW